MSKNNLSDIFSDLNSESSIILPKSIKIKNIKSLDTISNAPQKGGYLNATKNKNIKQLISATSDNNYSTNNTEELKDKLFNILQHGGQKLNFMTQEQEPEPEPELKLDFMASFFDSIKISISDFFGIGDNKMTWGQAQDHIDYIREQVKEANKDKTKPYDDKIIKLNKERENRKFDWKSKNHRNTEISKEINENFKKIDKIHLDYMIKTLNMTKDQIDVYRSP